MPTDWITTAEAVSLSGYHVDHIRRLIKSGKVKGQKWGREWQVSRSSLMAYLHSVEKAGKRRGRPKKTS